MSDEVKFERFEPLTMDQRALLLAEFVGGLAQVIVFQEMTRAELEERYPFYPQSSTGTNEEKK